jgi:hypothetical protein
MKQHKISSINFQLSWFHRDLKIQSCWNLSNWTNQPMAYTIYIVMIVNYTARGKIYDHRCRALALL